MSNENNSIRRFLIESKSEDPMVNDEMIEEACIAVSGLSENGARMAILAALRILKKQDAQAVTDERKVDAWITTEYRPDDGAELLAKEFPRFAFMAWQARAALSSAQVAADRRDAEPVAWVERCVLEQLQQDGGISCVLHIKQGDPNWGEVALYAEPSAHNAEIDVSGIETDNEYRERIQYAYLNSEFKRLTGGDLDAWCIRRGLPKEARDEN